MKIQYFIATLHVLMNYDNWTHIC